MLDHTQVGFWLRAGPLNLWLKVFSCQWLTSSSVFSSFNYPHIYLFILFIFLLILSLFFFLSPSCSGGNRDHRSSTKASACHLLTATSKYSTASHVSVTCPERPEPVQLSLHSVLLDIRTEQESPISSVSSPRHLLAKWATTPAHYYSFTT